VTIASFCRWSTLVCMALALGTLPGRAASSASASAIDLTTTLARAGDRVEQFFTRAQSLICTEIVSMQPLNSGFTTDGFARTVESELRLSWDPGIDGAPATEAQTLRQVVKVNGRPPRHDDRNNCTTPEQQETEIQPLSMLLPEQRTSYAFSLAGTGRVDGRAAVLIDFRELAPTTSEVRMVDGKEDCISYTVQGGGRGRLWVDLETSDVLRLDQRLSGLVDLRLPREITRRPGASTFWTLERSDTTIRFRRVPFTDPEESLVLPFSSTTLRIVRGSGSPRLRTETRYSGYRRFLTGGRIVGDDGE
jgi:hypothetical protein